MKSNKIQNKIESGHSETIFDLKYNKNDYGIFATCSHDSTIKIWDMNKNKIIHNINFEMNLAYHKQLKNNNDVLDKVSFISVEWSPNEKNLLISGDSQSYLRLWDIKKEKLLDSIRINTIGKNLKEILIIGLDWEKNDHILAAGGEVIKLFKYNDKKINLVNEFSCSKNVFQIKFNIFDSSNFFACCQDGLIRIFNEKNRKCTTELQSHGQKVFGISFNFEKKGVFASSSDDSKIGIWDLNKSQKATLLTGHTNKVRRIVWMKDQSNILISGSWDGDIRFWNIDSMICIYTIKEHYSDVYGLDICYDHPYLLMSSSRDNSIRFWNMPFIADNMV